MADSTSIKSSDRALPLCETDRQELERWRRSRNSARKLAFRAKLILQLAEGSSVSEVAAANQTPRKTVYKWRDRFMAEGLGGLQDVPRTGRPTTTDAAIAAKILQLKNEQSREGPGWSLRQLAEAAGTTVWQVRQILKQQEQAASDAED